MSVKRYNNLVDDKPLQTSTHLPCDKYVDIAVKYLLDDQITCTTEWGAEAVLLHVQGI